MNSLKITRNQLIQKGDDLRENLRKAPLVEKEYIDLLQDLDSNNLRYREVSARKMEAEISQQLEVERKGERFTLIFKGPQEALVAFLASRQELHQVLDLLRSKTVSAGWALSMEAGWLDAGVAKQRMN